MWIGLLGLGFGVQALGFEFSGGFGVWGLWRFRVSGVGGLLVFGLWFCVLGFPLCGGGGGGT